MIFYPYLNLFNFEFSVKDYSHFHLSFLYDSLSLNLQKLNYSKVSKYILDLISQGEHQNQDFKFEINDAKKIARTLVAFSNADGGKLFIGIKDNGKITGVSSEEEYLYD